MMLSLRLHVIGMSVLLSILSSCASTPVQRPMGAASTVVARGETVAVASRNADAADDPAIWRNPADPSKSLIVATDKKAGLYVHGLDGTVRHFEPDGLLNNVDLIDLGERGVLVAASDRTDRLRARVRLYWLDKTSGRLDSFGAMPAGPGESYGLCLYLSADALYAFAVLKDGTINQIRFDTVGDGPDGRIVRTMKVPTQAEGCVVDPRSATLFVGEEDAGIWRFDAAPDAPATGTLILPIDNTALFADVEGLAIFPEGESGGYLLASSQGDNAYAVFRLPDFTLAGRFRIGAGTFGATEETDGIAVMPGDFGDLYPGGLFVAQDGVNPPNAQNFKLVDWASIRAALALP